MRPIRIPHNHILTHTIMENTLVPLLYPLIGFICHMLPSCVRPVMLKNSSVTQFYCHIKSSRKSILFDDGSSPCMTNIVNNIFVLLSMVYYSWCYGLLLHTIPFFGCSFFVLKMMTKIFFLFSQKDLYLPRYVHSKGVTKVNIRRMQIFSCSLVTI